MPTRFEMRQPAFPAACVTESSPRSLQLSIPVESIHAVAAHGMKIECFFPFHSGMRVKTLALQCPRSMQADLNVFIADLEHFRGVSRAQFLYVASFFRLLATDTVRFSLKNASPDNFRLSRHSPQWREESSFRSPIKVPSLDRTK